MDWQISENDVWLKVDFENKDLVKDKGAKYDSEKKRWYIPKGSDVFKFREYWWNRKGFN